MKQVLSGMLLVALLLLSACAPAAKAPATAGAEPPYTVTMVAIGQEQPDQNRVLDAINAVLMEEMNMRLEIILIPYEGYRQQVELMLLGQEPVDLIFGFSDMAQGMVDTRAAVDLAAYLDDCCPNIRRELGDAAAVAEINQYVYGIPTRTDWYRESALMVRRDWLDQTGFAAADIRTVADVERLFTAVQAAHPEAVMLAMGKGQQPDSTWHTVDPLTDYFGVLPDYGKTPQVVNYFAGEEYRDFVYRQYRWAQRGWIHPDAAATIDTGNAMMGAGAAFAQISSAHPGMATEAYLSIGAEVKLIPLCEAYTTSTFASRVFWSVCANAADPVQAIRFLDYLYGSKELTDLLSWGIEGEHYIHTEDGHITFPEGVDTANAAYNMNYSFQLPNQFLAEVWEGAPLSTWTELQQKNQAAPRSVAYGFAYDGKACEKEREALQVVLAKYIDGLNTGALDPDIYLPRFLEELEQAGIARVMREKQRQLDAWLETT